MRILLLLSVLLPFIVGFSGVATSAVLAGNVETNALGFESTSSPIPVLGFIETRNWKVAVKTGGFYTIYSKTGDVLAEDVTLEQVQIKFPDIHKVLRDGVIGQPVDASVN